MEYESDLIEELLCPNCLRYFSHFDHLSRAANIRLSKRGLSLHRRHCRRGEQPYRNCVYQADGLEVFCVGSTPLTRKEVDYSAELSKTMCRSHEADADETAWHGCVDPRDREEYCPHAFIPVLDGRTTGMLVTRRRFSLPFNWSTKTPLSEEETHRWCVDRIWIHGPYRRQGIASRTVEAAAKYFHTEVSDMGWTVPFTEAGEALALSLCSGVVHAATW